ncbi:SDR family NAD(P)-dependent oxidoreductase [Streptomyces sp. NPDC057555]|uniref:SDR family NAD(P)-dependent oxidoreductase n=1 Tax=Streptomyces sp. NPDC057555 TaxID=3346166 RepID=UPI0036CA3F39
MPENARPEPRTAIVTGSSRGIGAAIARELAARGHRIVVNHRNSPTEADALAKEIAAAGGTAVVHAADVCDPEQAGGLVARAVEEFGGVDALVCNANVGLGQGSVVDMDWNVFAGKVNDELAAAFHVTQAAFAEMAGRGRGRIVYLSSDAYRGPAAPAMAAHSVAKSALNAYARFVAREGAPKGIGVNVLSPGLVRTDAVAAIPQEMFDQMVGRIPVGRAGEPEDVARAVGYLLSDDADYLVGQLLSLNGGSDLGR